MIYRSSQIIQMILLLIAISYALCVLWDLAAEENIVTKLAGVECLLSTKETFSDLFRFSHNICIHIWMFSLGIDMCILCSDMVGTLMSIHMLGVITWTFIFCIIFSCVSFSFIIDIYICTFISLFEQQPLRFPEKMISILRINLIFTYNFLRFASGWIHASVFSIGDEFML